MFIPRPGYFRSPPSHTVPDVYAIANKEGYWKNYYDGRFASEYILKFMAERKAQALRDKDSSLDNRDWEYRVVKDGPMWMVQIRRRSKR